MNREKVKKPTTATVYGDDRYDVKQILLHGFDSADTHHAINSFTFDPGGALYSIGAVVYGTQRPNPSPRWFGFHEVFHVLVIAAAGYIVAPHLPGRRADRAIGAKPPRRLIFRAKHCLHEPSATSLSARTGVIEHPDAGALAT